MQCPTLLDLNGYGGHNIEGIGDKHVPWIHNVRNTDLVVAVDDEQCLQLMRLFNEPAGIEFLTGAGPVQLAHPLAGQLSLLGISGICNLVAAIKTAKHFAMTRHDVVFIPLTDLMELYQSRLAEQRAHSGPFDRQAAAGTFSRYLESIAPMTCASSPTATGKRSTPSRTSPGSSSNAAPSPNSTNSGTPISGPSSFPRSTSGTG